MIEEALNELAFTQDPGLVRALRFLAPPGYQAIVELCSENGRSKRRDASVDAWSPEYDEVRIYFERIDGDEPAPRPGRMPRVAPTPSCRQTKRMSRAGASRRYGRARERAVHGAG